MKHVASLILIGLGALLYFNISLGFSFVATIPSWTSIVMIVAGVLLLMYKKK